MNSLSIMKMCDDDDDDVFTCHPPYSMLNGVSIVSAEHKSIDQNTIRLAPIR